MRLQLILSALCLGLLAAGPAGAFTIRDSTAFVSTLDQIEASLERAKLSRERLDLSRKNSELEERLEHIRRENRNGDESGTPSRRWLTKLGLSD